MTPERQLAESLNVQASPATVYAAVSDFKKMAAWSPEFLGAWFPRGRQAGSFVGFNRRGAAVWFTMGRITVAEPGREFAFQVSSLGIPVAQWGYRITATDTGSTVTEYWEDLREAGAKGRLVSVLSLLFTATAPNNRAARNRIGMQATLARLKQHLESSQVSE